MGFQSKTWSLSDEVVAEIERRAALMEKGSPNKVLRELFWPRLSVGTLSVDPVPRLDDSPGAQRLIAEMGSAGDAQPVDYTVELDRD